MPDVHLGKGATVGSVIATDGAVIPAAVGVDIGCGMRAVKLAGVDAAEDLRRQTEGVECRKDFDVLDEIPAAYKPIAKVMERLAARLTSCMRNSGSKYRRPRAACPARRTRGP